ncbi:MAG: CGNR zinc finger domain-containing protein [Pseudomonadota bacterium]
MGYSTGHPVRLYGGRLALDFVNTADWSSADAVVHEKLTCLADLEVWAGALGLDGALPGQDMADLHAFRHALRGLFLGRGSGTTLNLIRHVAFRSNAQNAPLTQDQSLTGLIALSAAAILTDRREYGRIKRCPGDNCGWLFVDETKNGRRTWCSMQSCGNRAKAARHYARRKSASRRPVAPDTAGLSVAE